MAKLFNFKKNTQDVANPETTEAVAEAVKEEKYSDPEKTASLPEESKAEVNAPSETDIDAQFFGKSLSFLSREQKRLANESASLEEKLSSLTKKYSVLLEERKKASSEQQQALSDFNEVSLEYHSQELSGHLDSNASDGEEVNDKKTVLQDMKAVENEKETNSARLDQELFETAQTMATMRAQLEQLNKTRSAIDKAILDAGAPVEEEKPVEEVTNKKRSLFKSHRKVANKVKGVNFLNLITYLKKDCELDYTVSKLIVNYAIVFTVIVLIGLLYSLQLPYVLILCLVYFIFGPSLIYFHYRKKYEHKKFTTCVRYIEQMIFSFTRNSKLLNALEETKILMSGKIEEAVDYAISKIRYGKSNQDLYKDALSEVEEMFPCARVKNLHELLIDVERVGGKHNASLDIMLEDVREWDVRTNQFQKEQSVKGMSIIVSILMSLGVCFFMTNILPEDMGGDISGFGLYQIVTTLSLIVMFFVYRFSARKLTSSWVSDDLGADEASIASDYETVRKYAEDPKGKIKPILAMTRIQTAMEKAFPRWVMRFALLATSRPIPVALTESSEKAPVVMKGELEKLTVNLEEDPYSIQPYVEFFKDFDLPQVRSMMMMVYSLGSSDSNDIDKHILSIVKRNHLLQATAEKIEYDEKMALFTLYSTVPMLLACVIMLIDVGMLLLNMMNTVM